MGKDQQIIAVIHNLILFLRSIKDEDQQRGQSAAENFKNDLEFFQGPTNRNQGLSNIQYSLGGKGILDWTWNSYNQKKIGEFVNLFWDISK